MEVQRQINSLSKGPDVKEDMAMVMTPHSNWEEYLMPAPMSIALIGQLMAISTKTDFSLENYRPEDGFGPIRNPKSFRACLQQVANEGYEGFSLAHKNMDGIRLLTMRVPGYMKDSLEILYKGSTDNIRDYLPIELNRIKHASDKCLVLAKEVEKKFDDLMMLTGRILEVSLVAKGSHEDQLKKAEVQKRIAEERKKTLEAEEKLAKERVEEIRKSYKKAQDSYYEAIEELPKGWDLVVMQVVESVGTAIPALINSIASRGPAQAGSGQTASNPQAANNQTSTASEDVITMVYVKAFETKVAMEGLLHFVSGKTIKIPEDKGDPQKALMYFQNKFQQILNDCLEFADSKQKQNLVGICEEGERLCDKLGDKIKQFGGTDDKTKKKLATDILALDGKVKKLIAAANLYFKNTQLQSKPPALNQQAASAEGNMSASATQLAVQQGKFQLSSAKEVLKHTSETYDKVTNERRQISEKLQKEIEEMSKLDVTKINFEQTLEVLEKGIMAFETLRQKWAKLVQFFQMTSNLIEMCSKESVDTFLEYSKKAQNTRAQGYSLDKFTKDKIYKLAFEGGRMCYLVNMISESYVEVSKNYLLDRIAGVGRILAYNIDSQAHLIEQEQKRLFADCTDIQADIQREIQERKAQFDVKIRKRLSALEAIEPPVDAETARRIERAVTDGRQEAEEVIVPPSADINTVNINTDDLF